MPNLVNGATVAGEFITGNMDFFTVLTLVPVAQTRVVTPVIELASYQNYVSTGTWTSVTVIDGTGTSNSYATLNTYLDAYYKQLNFDMVVRAFSTRAVPVAISANQFSGNIPGTATPLNANTATLWAAYGLYNNISTPTQVFGSSYTTGATYYSIHIATEKTLLWTAGTNSNFSTTVAADNTNTNGYNLLSSNATFGGLDTMVAYDLQSTQVLSGSAQGSVASNPYLIRNTVQPYVSTWNTSSASLTNTLAAQGLVLNTFNI